MGRYYYGDIEGKFWFAVQSSESPQKFGGRMELSYSFDEDDISEVKEVLSEIKKDTNIPLLDKFFKDNTGYNDEMLAEVGLTMEDVEQYADYELGKQILDCLEKNGQCNFWGDM
tara:strand:- start:751 stop:1092 length:342 start_codon:yes stop_codon:yes gene_type:complete